MNYSIFQQGNGISGGRVRRECSGRPSRGKNDDSKCSYRRVEKKPRREEQQRFFIKKETLLLEGAGTLCGFTPLTGGLHPPYTPLTPPPSGVLRLLHPHLRPV